MSGREARRKPMAVASTVLLFTLCAVAAGAIVAGAMSAIGN